MEYFELVALKITSSLGISAGLLLKILLCSLYIYKGSLFRCFQIVLSFCFVFHIGIELPLWQNKISFNINNAGLCTSGQVPWYNHNGLGYYEVGRIDLNFWDTAILEKILLIIITIRHDHRCNLWQINLGCKTSNHIVERKNKVRGFSWSES